MKMSSFRLRTVGTVVAGLLAAAVLTGFGDKDDSVSQAEKRDTAAGVPAPGFEEVKAIAEEGFVFGLPLVMNYAVMYDFFVDRSSGQYKAPFNQLHNEHRVFTYKDTAVITPNSDTPYSALGMDLRAEPLVVSIPEIDKARYFSVQLIDANTFNYGYIGSRATGGEAGDYLVAGPDWTGPTPKGVRKVFRCGTQFGLALFRTQLFNPGDMPNVVKVQSGYKVQPLSTYLNEAPPSAPPAVAFPKIDKDLVKTDFFEYLDFALQFAVPGREEKAIRDRLALIGVGPGKKFSFKDLSLAHKAEILLGMRAGSKKVDEKVESLGKNVNGWRVASAFGDRGFYKGDWLLRAAAARLGIYGNSAVEAMYPFAKEDSEGRPLDGSKNKYTLTFAANALPPARAFWSVTMYDGKTQLLIKNPLNRYLINSPMLPNLKKNKDGSLTIYIQKDSPGKAKETNWLPAPNGPIYLAMRLYWPSASGPSILPPGEGSWQPPAVVRVK